MRGTMGGGSPYGRLSELRACVCTVDAAATLRDVYCTAPFKLMEPMPGKNGMAHIIQLSASAGIFAGDEQEITGTIAPNTRVEWTTQSYEAIHPPGTTASDPAKRDCLFTVGSGGFLLYRPQASIPFANAAFRGYNRFVLENETSRLISCEILCGGRKAMGELFAFRAYSSLTEVLLGERLLYRENTVLRPDASGLSGIGHFEGFSHTATMILIHTGAAVEQIRALLDTAHPTILAAATTFYQRGIVVKMLGHSAQGLEGLRDQIIHEILPCVA